uniref:Uncharacterized protein n=1 Tax=Pararge aegeria TaxID=116150 RepID=S4PNX4_9NEOP
MIVISQVNRSTISNNNVRRLYKKFEYIMLRNGRKTVFFFFRDKYTLKFPKNLWRTSPDIWTNGLPLVGPPKTFGQ